MAKQVEYTNLIVFYNTAYLEQVTSIGIVTETGIQRVELLREGLGGFSSGSGAVTIEVGFVIPVTGQEQDFQGDAATEALVDLQVGVGDKAYAGRGKIENVNISQSAGAATEGTFNWTGPLKKFE